MCAVAARDPDLAAVVTAERTLSFGELDRLTDGLAAGLRELGVERGDHIAVVLPNGVEAAIAIYGILSTGAAFSSINPTIKRTKLGHALADSGLAAVICDAERAEVVDAAVALAGEIARDPGPWERVLTSGDLFRSDDEGYLYFVGDRDDLIKSDGKKVVPREIEDVRHSAPGVHRPR